MEYHFSISTPVLNRLFPIFAQLSPANEKEIDILTHVRISESSADTCLLHAWKNDRRTFRKRDWVESIALTDYKHGQSTEIYLLIWRYGALSLFHLHLSYL
jgi:hypothetical protein